MYRRFLLSFLPTLLLMPVVAQKPDMAVRFIPFDVERPYNPEHEMSLTATFGDRHHVVRLERLLGGKYKKTHFFHCFSRETGQHAGTLELEYEKTSTRTYFDRMLGLNDRFYLLHNDVNGRTGEVDVMAQEYDLPSWSPVGAPKQMARIAFDPKSLSMGRGFRSHIEISEDGEQVVLYFDRIRSADKEQLILLSVMDKDLNPLWQQGYRIPFESEKISSEGVVISDQGVVYALLKGRFKKREVSNTVFEHGYELFGMTKDGMASRPLDLPEGKDASIARLMMRNGSPVVAGFYLEPETSYKKTLGSFVSDFDPTFDEPGKHKLHAFAEPLDHLGFDAQVIAKRNGGIFLAGGAKENILGRTWDRYIVGISIGPDGEKEWEAVIPRKVYNMNLDDMGYRVLEGKERAVLVFREPSQNLDNYLTGEPLQVVNTLKRVTVVASIDKDGQVHYAGLSDGTALDCQHDTFSNWSDTVPYESIGTGKKKIGKKDVTGAVIMDLH